MAKGIRYEKIPEPSVSGHLPLKFFVLALMVIIFFVLDIFMGSVSISAREVIDSILYNDGSEAGTIIMKFRIPKALTALAVGMALSLSGLQMQTLFRNPLAGPDVLGVSSGASLGVAVVVLGFSGIFSSGSMQQAGHWILVISAWIGAGAVLLLILLVSSRIRDILTILILGIMLASGLSAVVSIMQYFSTETMLKAYVIWTMGSLGNLSSGQLRVLGVSVAAGVFLSIASVKMLNALLLGEEYASSIGLNVKLSRMVIFTCTAVLAGSVTAFCGPIGFIGIAVPHIARNIFRTSDHNVLVPGSLLTGGAAILASDLISQLPGTHNVLPVNSITSLIGIPVIIWIILKNKRNSGIY